jgi:hypothetical protein
MAKVRARPPPHRNHLEAIGEDKHQAEIDGGADEQTEETPFSNSPEGIMKDKKKALKRRNEMICEVKHSDPSILQRHRSYTGSSKSRNTEGGIDAAVTRRLSSTSGWIGNIVKPLPSILKMRRGLRT